MAIGIFIGKLSMVELNQLAAKLMIVYNGRSCTDVTGFGLYGHAENLCKAQKEPNLQFVINSLPILKGAAEIDRALNGMFKLEKGYSAETSGIFFGIRLQKIRLIS